MFGKNEIVGRKYFKDFDDETLLVTSKFMTLQGEGPFSGRPAFFIRLAKCNLACSFCDTFFDRGDRYTFDQLFQEIEKDIECWFNDQSMEVPEWASGDNKRMVLVVTGGEPALQSNLVEFLNRANDIFEDTQIESNGTLLLENDTVTYVCSPKCVEKNGKPFKYLKPNKDVLERADCLKFVMSAEENSPYSTIPEWAHEWTKTTGKPVYVSPMNIYNEEPQKSKELRASKSDITIQERSTVDEVITFWSPGLLNMEQNQINHEYTAKYAMQHGLRLNLQTHLYASLP